MTSSPYWIETEDWHTAGEPFRIVHKLPNGYLPDSSTVAQRRFDIIADPHHPLDQLRQSLCHEPRGHADMYGGFITPPDDAGATLGVLFWHKDGFSTACGHGTIALGYWAVANGIVKVPESGEVNVDVVIDVPSGRVVARMNIVDGKTVSADFINVTSYQLAKSLPAAVPSRGIEINVDLAFGGAVYATLDAEQLGLKVEPRNVDEFIKLGREIKASLGTRAHYGTYDCYGVIFFHEEGDDKETVRQRNVTVFADGQIDRSPCGSGTCARLAVLFAQGRVAPGKTKLLHRSIIASQFQADIVSEEKAPVEGFPACVPRVTGEARLCGRMSFYIDPSESIYPGFLLR
ncbi:hypothetical protein ACHAPT_010542 [Fusarium lateritium]